MGKWLPTLAGASVLVLLLLSFLGGATPALAACPKNAGECLAPPYAVPAEPFWGSLSAATSGNYPGGNESFNLFVINSDLPPAGNATLLNETVTVPLFPPASQNASATGLPVELGPGQAITTTISLPIPSDYSLGNFTAHFVAYLQYWNGTGYSNLELIGIPQVVFVLGPPATSTTTASTSTYTTTDLQAGAVSASAFEAGVGIPSVVAVILLALVVRGRGGPRVGT
jgi:hypothetical protein